MSGHRTRVQQQQQQQEPRVALTIAKLLWLTPARVARVAQAVRVLAQHTWRAGRLLQANRNVCNMLLQHGRTSAQQVQQYQEEQIYKHVQRRRAKGTRAGERWKESSSKKTNHEN